MVKVSCASLIVAMLPSANSAICSPAWSSGKIYKSGDLSSNNNANYVCVNNAYSQQCGVWQPGTYDGTNSWIKKGTCTGVASAQDIPNPITKPTFAKWTSLGSCPDAFSTEHTYKEEDVVEVDNVVYKCKAGAASAWCSMSSYEPHEGLYWTSAWDCLGACTGTMSPTKTAENDLDQLKDPNSISKMLRGTFAASKSSKVAKEGSKTQAPTSAPTNPPSPSVSNTFHQPLLTRNLAARINKMFSLAENDLDQLNGQNSIRKMLEGTFASSKAPNHRTMRSLRVSNFSARDDYFADLPAFVTHNIRETFECKCVDCIEDETCGGLWKASAPDVDLTEKKIHIVVSHCKNDLDWIGDFTKSFNIASIHVVSKCGVPVRGVPAWATIEALPNIGRCDHTYAYYITTVLPHKIKEGDKDIDSIVVFLKDDISSENFHQTGQWNDFEAILHAAASDSGFGCGIEPGDIDYGPHKFHLSAYHDFETLRDFSIGEYTRNIKGYDVSLDEFQSPHTTLGSWWDSLGTTKDHPKLVRVCYGGVFASSIQNIHRTDMSVWKAVEKSLSRGNNIQEGHYAERSWGHLLSTPLQPFQVDALVAKSDGVFINNNGMHAALIKQPKLVLHIGVQGTSSSELLAESLVMDISTLKMDGYNVAIHGKYDGTQNIFPNIDRLGSCMWSDASKRLFPEYMKEATVCPENVLPDLLEFMDQTMQESRDLILTNPWLSRRGTAESLSAFVGSDWDITIVVYYRRYFEWITLVFNDWRSELFNQTLTPNDIPYNAFRYIDFLRDSCKRLFYGKDVEEDNLPVRSLYKSTDTKKKVYMNKFITTEDFSLEELTDLTDYTYFAAKQYHSQPRFRQAVTIVNYHDIRGPEVNFYCHILRDALNACNAAVQREKQAKASFDVKDDTFVQQEADIPFNAIHAYEDIAIAAYKDGRLKFEVNQSRERFSSQILLWIGMIHSTLEAEHIHLSELPVECLYRFEVDRLLEVSLAYEKSLLPDFFESELGANDLREEYGKWRFCSIDTSAIVGDPRWDFIFKNASNFSIPDLPKAYIHVGAPKTGSTAIQNTMMRDRKILKQDKYFLALHGQHGRKKGEHIIDNTFVNCDRLAACIWSDEQRNQAIAGKEKAGSCPDYVLPTLTEFLSRAIEAGSDVVISNEWLSQPSSEVGLLNILDGWDSTIVIYYRRFFDWVISAHYQWHFDIESNIIESMRGNISLMGFLRSRICRRLFELDTSNTSDSLAELTDIPGYTYHIWKRYKTVYKKNIKVVNFHDGHIIQSFYCDVLDAESACEMEKDRLASSSPSKANTKTSTAFFDLAIGLYWRLGERSELASFTDMSHELGDQLKEQMALQGFAEDDLPKECLSENEESLLLMVSLEYERILLPGSHLPGDEEATRQHFADMIAMGSFCSVDVDEVLANEKWSFLVESVSLISASKIAL